MTDHFTRADHYLLAEELLTSDFEADIQRAKVHAALASVPDVVFQSVTTIKWNRKLVQDAVQSGVSAQLNANG